MLCDIYRRILFPLLALSRVLFRLKLRPPQALGFSAFGLFCLIFSSSILAGEVTLTWDLDQDPNLGGYRIYYGYAKGSYEGVLDVGKGTTHTLADLDEGQAYYFAVVAYDIHGEESDLSQEVAHGDPPTDAEGDSDENTLPDQYEADQAESESDFVPDASDEMDADAFDPTSAPERDSEDNQDHARSDGRGDLHVIPQSDLRIISVDSETLVGVGAAESAIDGQPETFWRTQMGTTAPGHPHEVVIALGGEYEVRGFRYLPRQDGKMDGMVGSYSFYVSEDSEDWGKVVMTGTFSKNQAEQEVTFPGKVGGFVRFVAHSEVNGKSWTSVAELNILGVR